jgi:hypothetical protein
MQTKGSWTKKSLNVEISKKTFEKKQQAHSRQHIAALCKSRSPKCQTMMFLPVLSQNCSHKPSSRHLRFAFYCSRALLTLNEFTQMAVVGVFTASSLELRLPHASECEITIMQLHNAP